MAATYPARARRLFSQLSQATIVVRDSRRLCAVVRLLSPPSPQAASLFSRLRVLELHLQTRGGLDLSVMDRLIPSPTAFPSLEVLDLDWQAWASTADVIPLARLPSLRCLRIRGYVYYDAFLQLCALPVHTLHLHTCSLGGSIAQAGTLVPDRQAVQWRRVSLPTTNSRFARHETRLLFMSALSTLLDSCALAADTKDGSACPPQLQLLMGGWDMCRDFSTLLARIPSLEELVAGDTCDVRTAQETVPPPDLSPLFTSALQPLLPRLRTFHFPDAGFSTQEEKAAAVQTSEAFLTAYTSSCGCSICRSTTERVRWRCWRRRCSAAS